MPTDDDTLNVPAGAEFGPIATCWVNGGLDSVRIRL